ncbi:hypothetical protein E2C01_045422 [Portunus trituberculatus]|uniref:Uncharacterized protein n=1 Tax=Portunus trituberculatus TaxID=210409 RepID=A0A5B7G2U2_PORTR|nr:hypothetical protein [Portunus trituberculatus]
MLGRDTVESLCVKMELLRRNVEKGTVRLLKERLPHGKNPGTVHEEVQQQGKPVCLRPKRSQ